MVADRVLAAALAEVGPALAVGVRGIMAAEVGMNAGQVGSSRTVEDMGMVDVAVGIWVALALVAATGGSM